MAVTCKNLYSTHPLASQVRDNLPWLMTGNSQHDFLHQKLIHVFSTDTILDVTLPNIDDRFCCGSSHGWLILSDDTCAITLLNPLTYQEIQLPPLTGMIHKAILSKNPDDTSTECIAMAIFGEGRELALCRIDTDETWSVIQDSKLYYNDIIYYSKKFYAVDEWGGLVMCDPAVSSPKLAEVTPPWTFRGNKMYLVAHDYGFLLVIRYTDKRCGSGVSGGGYKTKRFEVYWLDVFEREWSKVKSIGDNMLFLGQNQSISIPTKPLPQCAKDCIFFTDDAALEQIGEGAVGGRDIGVFSLKDGSIQLWPEVDSEALWPIPTWIIDDQCFSIVEM